MRISREGIPILDRDAFVRFRPEKCSRCSAIMRGFTLPVAGMAASGMATSGMATSGMALSRVALSRVALSRVAASGMAA